MTSKNYPNVKSLINSVLSKCEMYNTLKMCRIKFLINVLGYFSCIKGKINFLQLQRFSGKCEQYFSPESSSGLKTGSISSPELDSGSTLQ